MIREKSKVAVWEKKENINCKNLECVLTKYKTKNKRLRYRRYSKKNDGDRLSKQALIGGHTLEWSTKSLTCKYES